MPIKTILCCDKCDARLELEGPYMLVRDAMKAKGWRNVKEGESWLIRCPECRK
jgi:hypothetical protein